MSKTPVVSPEEHAANAEFLKERKAAGKEVRIQRMSKQARITHGITVSCVILLSLSGLFVFVPALTQSLSSDVVFAIRMSHRVIGVVFIIVPLISAILAPKGVAHIFKKLFARWDGDDKKWMALFMPYLFTAKHMHMPDQGEIKSGQRFADGMLWLFCAVMAISGVALLLGSTIFDMPPTTYRVLLLVHDIGFFFLAVFALAHIFLGSGIFQPYRGTARIMWGDGTVSESDALYHWGHWARDELSSGKNVVEVKKD